jgi:hypothetical protein
MNMKMLMSAALALGTFALSTTLGYAQGAPEVIVRRGDKIDWSALSGGPHRVKFGAAGTTSVAEINALLDFTPVLTPGGDSPQKVTGPLTSAQVKDIPEVVGKTFVFTCGVHPAQMLSLTFTIAEKVTGGTARTHKITGESGLHWHLLVDTTP